MCMCVYLVDKYKMPTETRTIHKHIHTHTHTQTHTHTHTHTHIHTHTYTYIHLGKHINNMVIQVTLECSLINCIILYLYNIITTYLITI